MHGVIGALNNSAAVGKQNGFITTTKWTLDELADMVPLPYSNDRYSPIVVRCIVAPVTFNSGMNGR